MRDVNPFEIRNFKLSIPASRGSYSQGILEFFCMSPPAINSCMWIEVREIERFNVKIIAVERITESKYKCHAEVLGEVTWKH